MSSKDVSSPRRSSPRSSGRTRVDMNSSNLSLPGVEEDAEAPGTPTTKSPGKSKKKLRASSNKLSVGQGLIADDELQDSFVSQSSSTGVKKRKKKKRISTTTDASATNGNENTGGGSNGTTREVSQRLMTMNIETPKDEDSGKETKESSMGDNTKEGVVVDDEEMGLIHKGAAMIHPKLKDIPEHPAGGITCCTICCILVFVIMMTLYSYVFKCRQRMVMLDADWPSAEEMSELYPEIVTPFLAYEGMYKAQKGEFVCGSYQASIYEDNNTGTTLTVYDRPCVLTGIPCENYGGNNRCPDMFLDWCGQVAEAVANGTNAENCAYYDNPLVSVVSVQCMTFFQSLSMSLVYITYIQLFCVAVGLVIYYGIYLPSRKPDGERNFGLTEMKGMVQDVAAAKNKK